MRPTSEDGIRYARIFPVHAQAHMKNRGAECELGLPCASIYYLHAANGYHVSTYVHRASFGERGSKREKRRGLKTRRFKAREKRRAKTNTRKEEKEEERGREQSARPKGGSQYRASSDAWFRRAHLLFLLSCSCSIESLHPLNSTFSCVFTVDK
jgi:hypothetical protein